MNSIATRLVLCGAASVQVTHFWTMNRYLRSGRPRHWYFNSVSCSGEGADLKACRICGPGDYSISAPTRLDLLCYLGRLRSKSRSTLWTMNADPRPVSASSCGTMNQTPLAIGISIACHVLGEGADLKACRNAFGAIWGGFGPSHALVGHLRLELVVFWMFDRRGPQGLSHCVWCYFGPSHTCGTINRYLRKTAQ